MSSQTCGDCGAVMVNTNKCTKCGNMLEKDQRVARPGQKKSSKDSLSGTDIVLRLSAMALLFFGFRWLLSSDDPPEPSMEPSSATAEPKRDVGDTHAAWAYVQQGVEMRLNNPSSADFPAGGYRDVRYLGDGRYSFNSHVDAKNAFGGTIRTNFSGVIKRVKSGWQMESLEFEQ